MDVKFTWIPTWHWMDHVSRSLGLFSKTTSWELGLSQNRVTMALRNLTTIDSLRFIMCEDPMNRTRWNSISLRAQSYMTSHYTLGPWPHCMLLGCVSGQPLDTFFWALTNSWSQLLARVWSGPYTFTSISLPVSDQHLWNHRIQKCFQTCLSWNSMFSNSRTDSQSNLSHAKRTTD